MPDSCHWGKTEGYGCITQRARATGITAEFRGLSLAVALLVFGASCSRGTADDSATRARRREALDVVIAAEARDPGPARAAAACPGGRVCDANESERGQLRRDLRQHLRADVRAFFSECRRRRDLVAKMITTKADASRLTAWNMANEIVGFPDAVPDEGGRGYLRAVLQRAFLGALADALDDAADPMTWQPREQFTDLGAADDGVLRAAMARAEPPPEMYRQRLDELLFYVGRLDLDEIKPRR